MDYSPEEWALFSGKSGQRSIWRPRQETDADDLSIADSRYGAGECPNRGIHLLRTDHAETGYWPVRRASVRIAGNSLAKTYIPVTGLLHVGLTSATDCSNILPSQPESAAQPVQWEGPRQGSQESNPPGSCSFRFDSPGSCEADNRCKTGDQRPKIRKD
jgi:hypothetical protein